MYKKNVQIASVILLCGILFISPFSVFASDHLKNPRRTLEKLKYINRELKHGESYTKYRKEKEEFDRELLWEADGDPHKLCQLASIFYYFYTTDKWRYSDYRLTAIWLLEKAVRDYSYQDAHKFLAIIRTEDLKDTKKQLQNKGPEEIWSIYQGLVKARRAGRPEVKDALSECFQTGLGGVRELEEEQERYWRNYESTLHSTSEIAKLTLSNISSYPETELVFKWKSGEPKLGPEIVIDDYVRAKTLSDEVYASFSTKKIEYAPIINLSYPIKVKVIVKNSDFDHKKTTETVNTARARLIAILESLGYKCLQPLESEKILEKIFKKLNKDSDIGHGYARYYFNEKNDKFATLEAHIDILQPEFYNEHNIFTGIRDLNIELKQLTVRDHKNELIYCWDRQKKYHKFLCVVEASYKNWLALPKEFFCYPVLELCSHNVEFNYNVTGNKKSIYLIQSGDFEYALEFLLSQSNKSYADWENIGALYEWKKDYKSAQKAYLTAIKLNGKNAIAANNGNFRLQYYADFLKTNSKGAIKK